MSISVAGQAWASPVEDPCEVLVRAAVRSVVDLSDETIKKAVSRSDQATFLEIRDLGLFQSWFKIPFGVDYVLPSGKTFMKGQAMAGAVLKIGAHSYSVPASAIGGAYRAGGERSIEDFRQQAPAVPLMTRISDGWKAARPGIVQNTKRAGKFILAGAVAWGVTYGGYKAYLQWQRAGEIEEQQHQEMINQLNPALADTIRAAEATSTNADRHEILMNFVREHVQELSFSEIEIVVNTAKSRDVADDLLMLSVRENSMWSSRDLLRLAELANKPSTRDEIVRWAADRVR